MNELLSELKAVANVIELTEHKVGLETIKGLIDKIESPLKMPLSIKQMTEMPLHTHCEMANSGKTYVRRVPGGWIYDIQSAEEQWMPVFVPEPPCNENPLQAAIEANSKATKVD